MYKYLLLSVFLILISGCGLRQNVLKQVSISKNPKLSKVFEDPEKFEVHIIYTRIFKKNGEVEFKDYKYRVDPEAYFYPASTVKLPVAALSLEKINELNKDGIQIDRNTIYQIENDSTDHTIAEDIKAIFAVSDNDAFNRLFEFLGQDYINTKLKSKGLAPVRISHRLSVENSEDTITRQIIFKTDGENYKLPITNNSIAEPLELLDLKKGKAYLKNGEQVNEPMDFAFKNYLPLETQHNLIKRLFFPDNFQAHQAFKIQPGDIEFLKNAMVTLPGEAGYDEEEFYDSYGKFFIYGDSKENIPPHIRIYNKVGYAYGTLTETAYIKDLENNVEFLLSATILVNENGVFNDNDYEYEETGIPFLAELGRQIYQKELNRKK